MTEQQNKCNCGQEITGEGDECPKCIGNPKRQEFLRKQRERQTPATLQDVKKTFQKWLYLGNDLEILDVVMAAYIDRQLPGDPLWLLLISASGGTKTEIVRANQTDMAYTLDSLTSHTLISGKLGHDKDGNQIPIRGILKEIDGKVLIIKDLTVILAKRQEERDEIFSQLRCLYDGYLEYGFGTVDKPIRVPAKIGLIAAVTPAVDAYSKMYVQLGERFLKVRHNPNSEKATAKAMANLGKEDEMREELSNVVERFLLQLGEEKVEPISTEFLAEIQRMAHATAVLRTPVSINFWRYEVNSALTPSIEYPTRLSKQLLKLAYALAVVRKTAAISRAEIETIRRVARDTVYPNRVKIIAAMVEEQTQCTTRNLSDKTGIPLSSCWRELKELEYLNVVKYDKVEEIYNSYTGATRHSPEKDGWTLRDSSLSVLLSPFSVSLNTSGGGEGVNKGKGNEQASLGLFETEHPSLGLCETASQGSQYTHVKLVDPNYNKGKCERCEKDGAMPFQVNHPNGGFGYLCETCGAKVMLEIGKGDSDVNVPPQIIAVDESNTVKRDVSSRTPSRQSALAKGACKILNGEY